MTGDMLAKLAVNPELFHTANGTAFADLTIDGHRETWPIRSSRFRSWLRRMYYEATAEAPSPATIRFTLDQLEARAQFELPRRSVFVRTAEHDGRVYLDLADDCWRSIAIGFDGWQVIECPPVRFRRIAGMLPLPVPERGGSLEALASFVNVPDRNDFILVVAWVLAALRQGGPYPVLAIFGEQGSAKTVLTKIVRALVDPNVAPVRTVPREERDLFIGATNSHLLAFDNLSDSVALDVRRTVPGRKWRQLCGPSALYGPRRGPIGSSQTHHPQRHRGCHHATRFGRPRGVLDVATRRRRSSAIRKADLARF